MMRPLFKLRKGPLFFGAAVVLFFTAGAWLDMYLKAIRMSPLGVTKQSTQPDQFPSRPKVIDSSGTNSGSESKVAQAPVRIPLIGTNEIHLNYKNPTPKQIIYINYTDQDFATIEHTASTTTKTTFDKDKAILEFQYSPSAGSALDGRLLATLPRKTTSLYVDGFQHVDFTHRDQPLAELNIFSCRQITIAMRIQRLNLQNAPECDDFNVRIEKNSVIDHLTIQTLQGDISIDPKTQIQHLALKLGAKVQLSGLAEVLKRAQWSDALESAAKP